MDFHISGLRRWLKFDIRISGKNLSEDKSKAVGCLAIALFEALFGA
jgi:hypothetical protein